jgi:HK97 gp10 family phage protein
LADNIRIEGLEEVLNRIEKIGSVAQAQQALGQACALVERSAKQKAPKGEGDLRRSITSKVDGLVGIVFTPLEYAPYVEYGTGIHAEGGNGRKDVPWAYEDEKTGELIWTSGQEPQPYMRPALYENVNAIKAILKEGITKK